ncbi:unnamed protein product [Schistosoma turkestanicum]|nr:unnamed protein product [Schistosoma turkestanicum]
MVRKSNKKTSKKKNSKSSGNDKIKKLEDIRRIAAANAKIWETRVEIAEKVKDKIQERAKQLADDNARLNDALRQSEKESMNVFSYLKKQNEDKDNELKELRDKIECMSVSHEKDKELIIRDAEQQISCISNENDKKCDKIKELEREILLLDEYKNERMRTDYEIKQLHDEVQSQKRLIEHMEIKFFEEKKDEEIELYQNEIEQLTEDLNKQKALFNEQKMMAVRNSEASVEKLTRTLELERKRTMRITGLANRILKQRSEIEEFFITSLNYVRDEIKVSQNNYIHDAKSAYEASIRLAHCGRTNYPPIRTFQNKTTSTNNVYDDFKIAQQIPKSTRLTIRDLTWEQKERVLSILFEKMNHSKMKSNHNNNNKSYYNQEQTDEFHETTDSNKSATDNDNENVHKYDDDDDKSGGEEQDKKRGRTITHNNSMINNNNSKQLTRKLYQKLMKQPNGHPHHKSGENYSTNQQFDVKVTDDDAAAADDDDDDEAIQKCINDSTSDFHRFNQTTTPTTCPSPQ